MKYLSLGSMVFFVVCCGMMPTEAVADDGGISFWLPGSYANLACVKAPPGFTYTSDYVHYGGSAETAHPFVISGSGGPRNVVFGLTAKANLLAQALTYTVPRPFAGAQVGLTATIDVGNASVDIQGTKLGAVPVSGSKSSSRTTISDVVYEGTMKWQQGSHNEMAYFEGNIPSGSYDKNQFVNLSLGFVGIDEGFGYTYLNAKRGHEFSIVGGLTQNFTNKSLQYKNGVDSHLDFAASQFFSKTVNLGAAGYYYQQLSADSGAGATLGAFKGQAFGLGPSLGWQLPKLGSRLSGNLSVRAYKDIEVQNRVSSYTVFVSFSVFGQHHLKKS